MCEWNVQLMMEKIQLLEFHQGLLLKLIQNPNLKFYRIIVENGISKQEMEMFFKLCEKLSQKLEEQKAEGFVYFYPLLVEFRASLPAGMDMTEVIQACLIQKLYEPLFQELTKYI